LSQVDQYLGLAGRSRNGAGLDFFRGLLIGLPRMPVAVLRRPRLAPDCRHAFAGIVAPDDIPVTRRFMVRGEPEHGFRTKDVPVEAPIVSEDELVEIRVDVLAGAAHDRCRAPNASSARRRDESRAARLWPGHLADRPRVVSVIDEPGIRSVPVGEQRRPGLYVGPHKRLDRSRGSLSRGMGGETEATRPSIQVFRSFPPGALGLVLCRRSITSTSAGDEDLPGFQGIEKAVVGPEKVVRPGRPPPRPPSGSRWGSIIDRRSFCASNQAVLYVMPSWASSLDCRHGIRVRCHEVRPPKNHTVSGKLGAVPSPCRP